MMYVSMQRTSVLLTVLWLSLTAGAMALDLNARSDDPCETCQIATTQD